MSRLKRILVGAGRLFDFSGSYSEEALHKVRVRRRSIAKRTAQDALRGDWAKIGADMRKAMDKAAENGQR